MKIISGGRFYGYLIRTDEDVYIDLNVKKGVAEFFRNEQDYKNGMPYTRVNLSPAPNKADLTDAPCPTCFGFGEHRNHCPERHP
jgi:hypothetical protein